MVLGVRLVLPVNRDGFGRRLKITAGINGGKVTSLLLYFVLHWGVREMSESHLEVWLFLKLSMELVPGPAPAPGD